MKIKQSFIDRCGEITVIQVREIQKITQRDFYTLISVFLRPHIYDRATDIWQATANVLKISLSDIYEVEQTPNTLTE